MVKIISMIELEDMEDRLKKHVPSAQLSCLKIGEAVPAGTQADCLIAVAGSLQGLDKIIAGIDALKWIHVVGAGIDGFPLDCLGTRMLTTSKGVSSVPIAEWVLAMILTQTKSLPQQWITQPPEMWSFSAAPMVPVQRQKLSILGFGSIGQAIAQRALVFDMQVTALTRSTTPQMAGVTAAKDLRGLLSDADHVVLAAPATPQTSNIINAESLSMMKPGAHLINIGRGELVDEEALKSALDRNHIACASLDVVKSEPLPEGHWLYRHEKIRLSPHISWGDATIIDRLIQVFMDNLKRFSEGQKLINIYNVEVGY